MSVSFVSTKNRNAYYIYIYMNYNDDCHHLIAHLGLHYDFLFTLWIVNVMFLCFFFSCIGSCDSQLVGIVPGPWHTVLVESAVNWSYIIAYNAQVKGHGLYHKSGGGGGI